MKKINFFKKKLIKFNRLFPDDKFNKIIITPDIKSLEEADVGDLTFFDSMRYKDLALKTKASYCLTSQNLKKFLPTEVECIIVKNVLFELAKLLKKIYPSSDVDYPDLTLKKPSKIKFNKVKFGNNVLLGKNVKIGKNSIIGSNSIIEHSVSIGENCIIGSNVVIKNKSIQQNTRILLYKNNS